MSDAGYSIDIDHVDVDAGTNVASLETSIGDEVQRLLGGSRASSDAPTHVQRIAREIVDRIRAGRTS